jgi:hypothetical protein
VIFNSAIVAILWQGIIAIFPLGRYYTDAVISPPHYTTMSQDAGCRMQDAGCRQTVDSG